MSGRSVYGQKYPVCSATTKTPCYILNCTAVTDQHWRNVLPALFLCMPMSSCILIQLKRKFAALLPEQELRYSHKGNKTWTSLHFRVTQRVWSLKHFLIGPSQQQQINNVTSKTIYAGFVAWTILFLLVPRTSLEASCSNRHCSRI